MLQTDRRSVNMVPTLNEYVVSILKTRVNKTLGASPFLVSSDSWVSRNTSLAEKGIEFKEIQNELIDLVWTSANGRPAQPSSVINALPIEFSGKTWQDKIIDMHAAMEEKDVDALIVSGLDETAWLFNLRASDIQYNPFFISYATIERTNNRTRLYLIDHTRKLTENPSDNMTMIKVADHLNTGNTGSCSGKTGLCVEVKSYDNAALLSDIDRIVRTSNKVWISFYCNYAIYSRIPQDKLYQALTPISYQKAKKNPVEREGLKKAHIRDAVALIKFIAKLEKEVS
ncbi:hypothetical protein KUTeg_007950 [Tegillarca granosa]|uniref:Uncharacterized protein n=1 Tax=Tegillarca granosa TaxID=220873 RepID=A0ABQ9FES2_TEGGR|nr:hypothetical protein KUTeg_007950 [Tegillarca granosa]